MFNFQRIDSHTYYKVGYDYTAPFINQYIDFYEEGITRGVEKDSKVEIKNGKTHRFQHSHSCKETLIEKIKKMELLDLLKLIDTLHVDITFFKETLRQIPPGYVTARIQVCNEIGEDKTLLMLAKKRLNELNLN